VPKPAAFPPAGPGHQHPRAQLLERAALALRAQRFGEAKQIATDILRASRTDVVATSILAHALMAQNRTREAIAPLEKVARRGNDPGIETLLGAALGGTGRRAEAIERLRRTIARRPPFLPAFQELAGQLAAAGRLGEAIAVIEEGLALAPGSIDLKLDLARLHIQHNERNKSQGLLLEACQAAPGRTDVLTTLARVLLLEGKYAEAADAYRRALALRPEDAMTRADLATCLLEMGDRDGGVAALRLALRSGPPMLGRATAALVHSSHGRFSSGRARLRRSCSRNDRKPLKR
jgi:tetratricopeptide (TPR) repeat protein